MICPRCNSKCVITYCDESYECLRCYYHFRIVELPKYRYKREERWYYVKGLEGIYRVSNHLRVLRYSRNGNVRYLKVYYKNDEPYVSLSCK